MAGVDVEKAGGVDVDAHERDRIDVGWEVASCPADAHASPRGGELPEREALERLDELEWLPAAVPGTAAAAMRRAGRWREGEPHDFDAEDWWFRTTFDAAKADAGEQVVLAIGGIATRSEVFLNRSKVLKSESMFESHRIDVGHLLRETNELVIRCHALRPLLKQRRKPRARWRTKLVDGGLRFHRTMLLGRAPGFAPGPAAVGPWRPIEVVRKRIVTVESLKLRATVDGADGREEMSDGDGLLCAEVLLQPLDGAPIESVELHLSGPSGAHSASLALSAADASCVRADGALRVPAVALWWPHTHGQPDLHYVRLHIGVGGRTVEADAGRVGFRTLAPGADPDHEVAVDGLQLHVNGVSIFARGAVWVTPDPIGLAPDRESLRAALQRAVDAGMNMLRIPGTAAYESTEFHELCDELGLLLWQDFMFANLDYPIADENFRATVEAEARAQLAELCRHPSLAVLCGNSEIEQQVGMLGLDPALGRGGLFGELLPRLIAQARSNAIYVPSAPCGGALPFRPGEGIANYYGVGGYRRPIEDARRSEVKFAAECLAFSNVPDEAGVRAVLPDDSSAVVIDQPAWKAGVPRDAGADWDFEDVRDHYLKLLFDVDPDELRSVDPERYLELSRAVTGEVMAAVLGEWRRERSPCGGALLLWMSDLAPGAGWGIVDRSGAPKPAYHHVRRALSPVAVWMVDEGLGGIRVHVANDRQTPLTARLRVSLYRNGEQRVGEAIEQVELPSRSAHDWDVESLLGHFVDVGWAYRFGPPGQDVVVASLERDVGLAEGGEAPADARSGAGRIISQAFHFPAGRPLRQESAGDVSLEATVREARDGVSRVAIASRRLAYGVRLHVPGLRAEDDAFSVEPGGERVVTLRPPERMSLLEQAGAAPVGHVSAINLAGRAAIASGRK